ncbi:MAG: hypothetical protein P1V35_07675 [Planctomycetota bacterium]|nr:hypothetical protein [Planctomycetota bacterium]
MKNLSALLLLALSFASCSMTEAPRVRAEAMGLTSYSFRGAIMSERPVVQGSMTTEFMVNERDRLDVTAWGNMSLTASTGDALFASTDILDVEENRWVVDYHHPINEKGFENFHAGIIQYSREGLATRELFAATNWDWKKFTAEVATYWDFDEGDGVYANGSLKGYFDVDSRTAGYWKASLGVATSNMADFLYGDNDAGLSDLTLEAGASRPLNKNTTMHTVAAFSTVLADDDALDAAGIDSTHAWIGMGVKWSF